MKISVIVCAKNDGKYLKDCLALLQAQQPLKPEIIVVYAESTDNTLAIAKKYADIVVRDNGRGLTDARNVGWKVATGDIVAYCDADALPDKNWTAKIACHFSNSDLLALSGPLGATSGNLKLRIAFKFWAELFPSLFAAIGHHNIWGANMAFRRSILEKFPFRAIFLEDFDIGQRLRRAGFGKQLRFDRKLKMMVSSRRFEKSFYKMTLKYYAINWLFMIFNKPPKYTYYNANKP